MTRQIFAVVFLVATFAVAADGGAPKDGDIVDKQQIPAGIIKFVSRQKVRPAATRCIPERALASDLDGDGDLDWIVTCAEQGGWSVIIEERVRPRVLGYVLLSVSDVIHVLPERMNGFRVIEWTLGYGPDRSLSQFLTFDGKQYKDADDGWEPPFAPSETPRATDRIGNH